MNIYVLFFLLPLTTVTARSSGVIDLPKSDKSDLFRNSADNTITVINDSDQPIDVRISVENDDRGDPNLFRVHPRSRDTWTRQSIQIARIGANGDWHDFRLSPGSVIRYNSKLYLEIVDGVYTFIWDTRIGGPHI